MSWTMDRIFKGARRFNASDIHLVQGLAPVFRVNGEIRISEGEPLDEAGLKQLVNEILTDRQRQVLADELQLCFSQQWAGAGRYRTSIYFHAGCPEMAIRLCETKVRTSDELGLPKIVEELTRIPNGLILVTGPTGMGKTTTLNYMLDTINQERRCKIVTIEDPVEFVHENHKSIIIQQEVGTDTLSFRKALVHVLRQDPDVVVIGEMRNLETIETALTAAETGHLVLATLHTPDALQTIQRIFSVFPSEQQNNIVEQLANCLQAIICQRLLPGADGKKRVLAMEICLATPAVRKHIREREPHVILSDIQMGRKHQMQSMDNALLELYQRAEITYDVCLTNARDQDYIRHKAEGK